VSSVVLPEGYHLERLRRDHPRSLFASGENAVDQWLSSKALQHQEKHLSATKVLVEAGGRIAGYFTLATGQVDFSDLPAELTRRLPRRVLPVAILAWLGVSLEHQGQGLGKRLLAQALRDCFDAGQTFAFVAVVLDCLSESAKSFYRQWGFEELPGHPNRLFVSAAQLDAIMRST
jgi:GNAT superfamily N-acetyltransferase